MFIWVVLESPQQNFSFFTMLEARSLSCRRGGRAVFRDIRFRLAGGDLLQITGANGSGKSTLLRALAGLLPLAGGEIVWQGQPVMADIDAYHTRLHYIGHQDALKPELSVEETLGYWRALRAETASTVPDWFGIDAFRHKPVRHLSAGQKRRLSLSRLSLGSAWLWLLDEPTTALDSEGQKLLTDCIAAHRAKGGIVIAAVHHAMDAPISQNLNMSGAV